VAAGITKKKEDLVVMSKGYYKKVPMESMGVLLGMRTVEQLAFGKCLVDPDLAGLPITLVFNLAVCLRSGPPFCPLTHSRHEVLKR
jgi:hypothetical protein